jgi:two pore calcium channel protein 1
VGSALGSGGCVHYHNDKGRTKWEEAALFIREGEDNHKFYSHPTGKWSMIAYKILHHPVYHVFHLALSALLMALALLEKPAITKEAIITVHGTLETLFLCLLGMDIILKLIWLTPEHFIQHRRTMFIVS